MAALAAITCVGLLTSCASTNSEPQPTASPASTTAPGPGSNLGLPTSSPLVGPAPGESKTIHLPSGREFLLHLPANYDPSKKWPLVLSFHGWKETSGRMYQYTKFTAAEAITVYPQGIDQAWGTAPYATTTGEEDVAFVADVIDTLRATYPIEDRRIHAAGMSNGGGFAAYLSCQMPGVFRSVASVSAAFYFKIHKDCAYSPAGRLDIHGTDDPIVSYFGGTRHGASYRSVQDVLAMDQRRNGCDDHATVTRISPSALRMAWRGCKAPLEHIRIGGGGHNWPGGSFDKTGAVPPGFASDAILDFFAIPGREPGTESSSDTTNSGKTVDTSGSAR